MAPAVRRVRKLWWVVLMLAGALVAGGCSQKTTPIPTTRPTTPRPTPTTAPTEAPTEIPQRLIACTMEPDAVSPFVPTQASADLLALTMEPAIERIRYGWEARLAERVPSLATGDVITRMVPVATGTRYADALGLVQQYTGTDTIQLPQMVVTYTLKEGLLWSDGEPITAKDAVLGYHLAQADEARGNWRDLVERTARFTAVNNRTVRWEGIPGYLDASYPGFMFPLQPEHRWGGQSLAEILQDRTPPATGAFRIVAWESGREVRLEPNPNYSGASPTLKQVIVRFPQYDPASWYNLLADGTCDLVLPDPAVGTSWQQWGRLGAAGEAIIWADVAPSVLRLDLNTAPEPGPDGTAAALIEDPTVRQAVSACIDREALTQALAGEVIAPADGFFPPGHPDYVAPAPSSGDAKAGAMRLLEDAGWIDEDKDGTREAHDVADFDDGTPLSITLTFVPQYFAPAAYIAADLETCGIKAALQPIDLQQFITPGPSSPLYGRWYQMALLGWQAELPQICGGWLSSRIPSADNGYQGENFSGFASEAYDTACLDALSAIEPDTQATALHEAEALLEAAHATVFLAWRPFWFVARPEVQGLVPDASADGTLWNIEDITIGAAP